MKRAIAIAASLLLVVIAGMLGVGRIASAPANTPIGSAPEDLPAVSVEFDDRASRLVSGWVLTGARDKGAVLLCHGIRSNRRSMLGRARMLAKSGYSVMMIDLQAHGESAGERLTFGYREADSVAAATAYARKLWPDKKLAIVGTSLGGAAAIFASSRRRADAYVLEAVYSSLHDATANRLRIRLGPAGAAIAPLLLWQTRLQLRFHAGELSAVDRVSDLKAPVLFIAGQRDSRTTLADSQLLFSRAGEPKDLWVVARAGHQDFHRFDETEYRRRVLKFLEQHMKQDTR